MNVTPIKNNLTLLELCLHIKSLTDDFYLVGGCVRNMLLNKIIRFIGKPTERINEDFLRVFRAYRFSSQLGFRLESKTHKACRTHFETACKTISSQRILNEVEKMCL